MDPHRNLQVPGTSTYYVDFEAQDARSSLIKSFTIALIMVMAASSFAEKLVEMELDLQETVTSERKKPYDVSGVDPMAL